MKRPGQRTTGFTIVELLIVIVVIAILAAITIVAYNGIQNKAKDTAVQSDLNGIAKKIQEYAIVNGAFPMGATQLDTLNIRVSQNAYGNHYDNGSGTYNMVYCWPSASNPNNFAIAAATASGKLFVYVNGSVREFPFSNWAGGSLTICSNIGSPIDSGSSRDWFYSSGAWQSYAY